MNRWERISVQAVPVDDEQNRGNRGPDEPPSCGQARACPRKVFSRRAADKRNDDGDGGVVGSGLRVPTVFVFIGVFLLHSLQLFQKVSQLSTIVRCYFNCIQSKKPKVDCIQGGGGENTSSMPRMEYKIQGEKCTTWK